MHCTKGVATLENCLTGSTIVRFSPKEMTVVIANGTEIVVDYDAGSGCSFGVQGLASAAVAGKVIEDTVRCHLDRAGRPAFPEAAPNDTRYGIAWCLRRAPEDAAMTRERPMVFPCRRDGRAPQTFRTATKYFAEPVPEPEARGRNGGVIGG